MNRKGFIKVGSAIMMKPEYVIERLPNGNFIPSAEFLDLLNRQTEEYREPIITFINDVIPYDWAISFTPFTEELFEANIFCDTYEQFFIIVNIIKERLPNKKFYDFLYKGKVSYIVNQD